jgi:indole-3-glycerol phosphate synthase
MATIERGWVQEGKMAVRQFDIDTDAIVAAKRERLRERQIKTPSAAVIALAEMQQRPRPVLNIVTGGQAITLIGQINYGEIYDPVGTALRYARVGVDAVAFFTDQQVYQHGLEDMLLVSRAIKYPIISQDFILDGYHVAEARAAGASALTLYASILDSVTLRRTVSLTQRWRMTAIVQVENREQLEYARDLSPHVVAVGQLHERDASRSLQLLADLRPQIPYNFHCMLLHSLSTMDQVSQALDLGVDAIMVDAQILDHPAERQRLLERLKVRPQTS